MWQLFIESASQEQFNALGESMASLDSCLTQLFYIYPACRTPVYTWSPSTVLCTKVGMHNNLCTYPTVIFIIQGLLLRAASPQGIPPPSHYPHSSLRSGHMFVSAHASTLVPRTYSPGFPDSWPEIASVWPLSVAKIIGGIATQVFSLAMISRGRNSEREERRGGRRKCGRRERIKPIEESPKRIQCLAHHVLSFLLLWFLYWPLGL